MKDIFTYTDNLAPFTAGATQVIIPKSISSKADLLRLFSERLSFPKGFGSNWDALFDCLRDLSWLREGRVVVIHEGIPAMLSADDLRAYLGLLGDAVVSWQNKPGAHELVVVFPAKETKQV
jgi:hypothetical protein